MRQAALRGKVCLVAGASRGLGRGIARGLGEAGATVIVTARSSETGPRTEMRQETIEDTAREVDAAGGAGHHYVCDHTSERAVDELVHWCTRRFGRIDVAVSSVWAGNEGFDGEHFSDGVVWGTPFWRRSTALLSDHLAGGVRPSLLLARALAPAMIAHQRGLIVFVSFGTDDGYLGDIYFDLAKAATNRLALGCAADLAPHGICCVSLSPGFVRTERVHELGRAALATETPLYAGRAVAALAADEWILTQSGRTLHVAELARKYGFTDADGSQPERFLIEPED